MGTSTVLGELFFWRASNLVRDICLADICVAWLVYVRTYCVPIATLNQNKKSELLYFGPRINKKMFQTYYLYHKAKAELKS